MPEAVADNTRSPALTSDMNLDDPDSRDTVSELAKQDFDDGGDGVVPSPSREYFVPEPSQAPVREIEEVSAVPVQSVLV